MACDWAYAPSERFELPLTHLARPEELCIGTYAVYRQSTDLPHKVFTVLENQGLQENREVSKASGTEDEKRCVRKIEEGGGEKRGLLGRIKGFVLGFVRWKRVRGKAQGKKYAPERCGRCAEEMARSVKEEETAE